MKDFFAPKIDTAGKRHRAFRADASRQAEADRLNPLAALFIVLALAAAIVAGLFGPMQTGKPAPDIALSDCAFYTQVIGRLRAGEPYYAAAMDELRQRGQPVKPFVTVRPPTQAVLLAALPSEAARILCVRALAIAVLLAWMSRFFTLGMKPLHCAAALLTLTSGVAMAFAPQAYLMHETWAGLLISLSLALRSPNRWGASVLVGLAAALVRELAAPYLLVMAVLALWEGRRMEAGAWLAALAGFALALALHAHAVHALLLASDTAAPGWVTLGGWPFVLHAASWNVLALLGSPRWIAVLFPVALAGLALWPSPLGRRAALTVLGYAAALFVVGRPVNFYWGLLIAPLWPLGLAMALPAAAQLRRATLGVKTVQLFPAGDGSARSR